ncbi:MAG: tyrosine-type recombinase/integrase [Bacteroidia bacterium]|nr:tyrosine-type recombinase/integrase [Bacteroidia bacterium]
MLIDQFIAYLKTERNYSPHTLTAYAQDLGAFQEFLQEQYETGAETAEEVQQINHRQIRNWMGEMLEKGLEKRTVARKVAAVSTFFKFLQKSELVTTNPASRVKVPKFEKKLPAFLKEKDALSLFEDIEYPEGYKGALDLAILEVLYGCGLRRAELIELLSENVDFAASTLKVMGKGRKERVVPLGQHAAKALKAYQEECKKAQISLQGNFFKLESGQPLYPKYVYNVVTKYLPLVSTVSKRSPHVLRHTFATHLLNAGADLNAIKELLGHKSLAATQVYVHNSISKLKNVYKNAHPKA